MPSFLLGQDPGICGTCPKGSQLVQNFLVQTAEGLVGGGKQVFAVSYLFLFELIAKFLICCI